VAGLDLGYYGLFRLIRKCHDSVDFDFDIVHLFLSAGEESLTANLTTIDGPVLIQKGSEPLVSMEADVTFNARAQIDPGQLQRMSLDTFQEYFPSISVQTHGVRSLRPGRPQPTFRYSRSNSD
jgi:hypothetical protein